MDRELNRELHEEEHGGFPPYFLSSNVAQGISPAIWAAGVRSSKAPLSLGCVRDMVRIGEEYGAHWLCAGKRSASGHPHHPLYLRKDEKTESFDIKNYLESPN